MNIVCWWHSLKESDRAQWAGAIATAATLVTGIVTVAGGKVLEHVRFEKRRRISAEYQSIPLRLALQRIIFEYETLDGWLRNRTSGTVPSTLADSWKRDTTDVLSSALTDVSAFPQQIARDIVLLRSLCEEVHRDITDHLSKGANGRAAMLTWPEGGSGPGITKVLEVARSLSERLGAPAVPLH